MILFFWKSGEDGSDLSIPMAYRTALKITETGP